MFGLGLLLQGIIPLVATFRVNTTTGPIIGSTTHFNGKDVDRYLGIPFAEPPVGDLRFRKTVPVKPWSTPLKTTKFPPSCVQYYPYKYPWNEKKPGNSEDCLYLNIWVPKNDQTKSKAVMFWIFSGGFSVGSNRLPVYRGDVLAAEGDVIVVTINYRLGILGFLSTESEEAPGNMGLYDMLEALKWVNNNIQAFGGDKNRITLFGHSAGAMSSGYFLTSPLAKGLYQRVIMESGNPLVLPDGRPMNLKLGQKVAKAVGCASDIETLMTTPGPIIDCLKKKDADYLANVSNSFDRSYITTFVPIYKDQIIPVDPQIAFKVGDFQDIDLMVGGVKDDASVFLPTSFPKLFGSHGKKNPKISKSHGKELIRKLFMFYHFEEEIADYYLSNTTEYDYDKVESQTYHVFDDFLLFCPSQYVAEKYSEKMRNTYFYYFYHQSRNTGFAPWMGVTHFTEVPFVFGRPLDKNSAYTEAEAELSKKMIEYWSNFAKDGVPSSTWKQYSKLIPNTEHFYAYENETKNNYLEKHRKNCEFLRPFLGFV